MHVLFVSYISMGSQEVNLKQLWFSFHLSIHQSPILFNNNIIVIINNIFNLRRFVVEQICNNNCCVVNNLFFVHPPLACLLYQCINCVYWSFFSLDHIYSLLVVNKLPESIRGNHKELVCCGVEFKFGKFGVGDNSSRVCNDVSKRPKVDESPKVSDAIDTDHIY